LQKLCWQTIWGLNLVTAYLTWPMRKVVRLYHHYIQGKPIEKETGIPSVLRNYNTQAKSNPLPSTEAKKVAEAFKKIYLILEKRCSPRTIHPEEETEAFNAYKKLSLMGVSELSLSSVYNGWELEGINEQLKILKHKK